MTEIPASIHILDIDASAANPAPDGSPYSGFREEIDLITGVTNVVDRPFFLPRIAVESLTTVDPTTTTMVENPTLAVMIEIPPFTAENPDGSDFTGELSISEVPEGMAPAALPAELEPGLLITIQPVGVTFDPPVPITFANIDNLTPGSETDIWSLDAATGTFVVVGKGLVSDDGSIIETIEGGIRAADWHFPLPPGSDGDDDNDERDEDTEDPDEDICPLCASSASPQTGGFVHDIPLPSYRSLGESRGMKLMYNSLSADPRPIIPFDSTIVFQAAVPPTVSYTLDVAGVQQGSEVFVDTAGLDENVNETIRNGVQLDATAFPTGRYPYSLRVTSNYAESSVSATLTGEVLVNNESSSPFGAGWGLSSLSRLHENADGSILVTQGDGSARAFRQCAQPPAGLVSWWPCDGDANDFIDGNSGTLQNGATFAPGHVGQALSLDGVDDFVKVPRSPNLDVGAEVTIDFWMKADPSNPMNTCCQGLVTTDFYAIEISGGFSPNVGINFFVSTDGGSNFKHTSDVAGSSFSIPPGEWHHVAGVYDGAALKLYVDGVLVRETPHSGNISPMLANSFLSFGSEDGRTNCPSCIGTRYFHGLIDEVEIFDRALNAAEIRAIFRAGSAGKCKDESPGEFVAPAGDFSTLVMNPDGTFSRTLKNGTETNFNVAGLHLSTVDRNGNATAYGYDAQGRLTEITDPVGALTTLSYGPDGLLSSSTDPAGRVAAFLHDAKGNLTKIIYPDGSTTAFEYNSRHLLTKQTDQRGSVFTHEYDFAGRFVRTIEPDGSTRELSSSQIVGLVDTSGGLGTSPTNPAPIRRPEEALGLYIDANGNPTVLKTDSLGAITRQEDALGRITNIVRDENSNPIEIRRPNGAVTRMTYDERGNLLTTTEATSDPHADAVVSSSPFPLVGIFGPPEALLGPPDDSIFSPDNDGPDPGFVIVAFIDYILIDGEGPDLAVHVFDFWVGESFEIFELLVSADGNTFVSLGVVNPTLALPNLPQTLVFDLAGTGLSAVTHVKIVNGIVAETQFEGPDLDAIQALNQDAQIITRFEYEPAFNQVASITDPNGNVTRINYDSNGNPIEITDALGTMTVLAYGDPDCRGQLTAVTSAAGLPEENTTTFEYDPTTCNLLRTMDPLGNTTALENDAAGNVIQSTDAEERVTRFQYDAMNRLTKVIDATNADPDPGCGIAGVTCHGYDPKGNLTQVTDGNGNLTAFEYDALDRLMKTVDPVGNLETFSYDGNGNLASTVDRKGQAIEFDYDAVNQLIAKTWLPATPEEAVTSFGYDSVGNLISAVDPDSSLAMTHDLLSRLTSMSTVGSPTPPGTLIEYTYDNNGNRISMTSGTRVTVYENDFEGTVEPEWSNTSTDVTPVENRRFLGQFLNGTVNLTLNDLPSHTAATVSFELFIIQTWDGNGTAFGPDVWELGVAGGTTLLRTTFGNFSGARQAYPDAFPGGDNPGLTGAAEIYTLGFIGQFGFEDSVYRLSFTFPHSASSLGLDFSASGLQFLADESWGLDNVTVELIADTSAPTGTTTYTYDELNRLTAMTNPSGQASAFEYDPLSRRTGLTLPNGVETTYSYDDASQLLSLVNQLNGSPNPISSFAYTYDGVGNRTSMAQERSAIAVNPLLDYAYDDLNRLIEATRPLPGDPLESFDYDPVGNRLLRDGQTESAVLDAANRLLEDEEFTYDYDANGNLVQKTEKATGDTTTYAYDPENHLVRIDLPAGGVAEYRYDGLGRRIEKSVDGEVTRYVYDKEDILLEFDGAVALVARYRPRPRHRRAAHHGARPGFKRDV